VTVNVSGNVSTEKQLVDYITASCAATGRTQQHVAGLSRWTFDSSSLTRSTRYSPRPVLLVAAHCDDESQALYETLLQQLAAETGSDEHHLGRITVSLVAVAALLATMAATRSPRPAAPSPLKPSSRCSISLLEDQAAAPVMHPGSRN